MGKVKLNGTKKNGVGTAKPTSKQPKNNLSYVNVKRSNAGYKDKYLKDVQKALKEFVDRIGKTDESELTDPEWKRFFKTVLIPLDKESERHMIELFRDNRDELNELLILHNTKASDNLAEVYFKKYEKECPTRWYDLEDFKQQAMEGLAIAAQRFKPEDGNKFITYATWWILNRVRKPYQENGAMVGHTSLSSPSHPFDSDSTTTLEDTFTSDMISPDYIQMGGASIDEGSTNPVTIFEKKRANDAYDLCSELKKVKTSEIIGIDQAKELTTYLMSVVDKNRNSYSDNQILLYMFRKIFKKCQSVFPKTDSESKKIGNYISQAAKTKAELLTRIGHKDENGVVIPMNESQYADVCNRLVRKGIYDGI